MVVVWMAVHVQALEAALKSGGATSGLLDSAKAQWASADTIDTVTQKALRNGATAAATLDNSQKAAIKDLAKVCTALTILGLLLVDQLITFTLGDSPVQLLFGVIHLLVSTFSARSSNSFFSFYAYFPVLFYLYLQVRLEGPQFESMEKDLKTLSSAIKTLQPVPTQASSGEKALKQAATKAAEAKVI